MRKRSERERGREKKRGKRQKMGEREDRLWVHFMSVLNFSCVYFKY